MYDFKVKVFFLKKHIMLEIYRKTQILTIKYRFGILFVYIDLS